MSESRVGSRAGSSPRGALLGATGLLVLLALCKLMLHLLTSDNYGYSRDELYYKAAGERVDMPR